MIGFIHPDFLLDTDVACDLYHSFARRQPIIDYHCYLSPELIATNHQFRSMTELWLEGDHYKWRAMRTNGIAERFITGSATDQEKFYAWAQTVPYALRNPLYHWTHLELAFPFKVMDCLLSAETAMQVYTRCNDRLSDSTFFARGLLRQFNIAVLCTTDDPTDSLEHHTAYANSQAAQEPILLPTWRPDRALAVDDLTGFNVWIERLAEVGDKEIGSFNDFVEALERRHQFFHDRGCRLSDHGLERFRAVACSDKQLAQLFAKLRHKKPLTREESAQYQAALLHRLAVMDHEKGWVQQFRVGALRNNNTRLTELLGADAGFDSIGDWEQAQEMSRFLDKLDQKDSLTKTILYNLNPRDNEVFACMVGNFQDGVTPGKLQWGGAWWFLEQLDGMRKQLDALSHLGLLSRFVGMATDSRSFLSFSRHDYFRRLLCNMLGEDVRRGLLPNERELLGWLVTRVCYNNARRFFEFPATTDD